MALPSSLPQVPYVRDLLDQPAALARTLEGLASVRLSDAWGDLVRRPGARVVLTGMGASLAALVPLHLRLLAEGIAAFLVETSELIQSQSGLLATADGLVVVSQSGASAETVRLLEVRPPGARLLGITNTPGSPLATGATDVVRIHAGEETSVSCKTYSASLVALDWVGQSLGARGGGGVPGAWFEAAVPVTEAMRTYLADAAGHVADLGARVAGRKNLFLAGRGASLAAVACGALIAKEASGVGVEGMSGAAFRHGPLEMAGPATLVLVLEGEAAVAALNRRLVEDLRGLGGAAEMVGPRAETGSLRLPEVAAGWRSWVEILPFQMLSVALAMREGRVPGRFERTTKVTTTE